MDNKYNRAISNINIDEAKQNEIINNLKEKNIKNKGVIFMSKIKRVLTTLEAIAGIAVCGGAVYAGLTGKFKLFNSKVDTEYENYATVVENKFVENEDSKITLETVACDDAYLILNYTIDVKEPAKDMFNSIVLDNAAGFELNFFDTIKIDDKELENYGNFSQKIAHKITNSQAKVYEIVDLTNMDISTKFELELSEFKWYGKDMNKSVEIEDAIKLTVSKEDAKKNTTAIVPKISAYNYKDLELNVEKIVKTPFESFIIIKTVEKNVTSDRYPDSREEELMDLSLDICDENDKLMDVSIKSIANLLYEDGTYYTDAEGKIANLNYSTPGEKFKNAKIYTYFVIATDNKLDNAKNFSIKPYYTKYADNAANEKKFVEALTWNDVKNEKVVLENRKGGKVTVNKIEVREDRILIYYLKDDSVTKADFFFRNKERALNYFNADIKAVETGDGEYVVGIRTKDHQGYSTNFYEEGDTDETADPEKYTPESYLSDSTKLVFAVDFGDTIIKENLGDGLKVNI